MTISGFTFVKNGEILEYPFIESIQSILPVCDEVVVVVGDNDDNTKSRILALNEPKINIIDSVWDPALRKGGQVLAQQTNIALDHIKGDWGLYIQADEVLHERYLPAILAAAKKNLNESRVEGFLFAYRHFYGSYDYIGLSRDWYRNEIRMVRNLPHIRSYKDAQGFRTIDNRKLRVKSIEAEMYHYGWVRSPLAQQKKKEMVNPLWHDDEWMAENVFGGDKFRYNRREWLSIFEGTHPKVMQDRIEKMNWKFPYDANKIKIPLKERISFWLERKTGIRLGEYKNYDLI
ncbi:MAG TPA: glycosyl transferase [Cytophagales bacterium]|jgi:glycosyltransferase involved in cell wall biosynthesis|nr:glycosyl transferase [Cytophagales bacterium]